VTIRAAHDGNLVRLVVADAGCGIDPEHLPHVFDRFYRADPSRARATGGAGLGLAIVRQLVVAHGGSVVATSDGLHKGATFIVTLPLSRGLYEPPATLA
jgi:two-component system sensor histidine kinase BaeS